jgi:hypothetical protein
MKATSDLFSGADCGSRPRVLHYLDGLKKRLETILGFYSL